MVNTEKLQSYYKIAEDEKAAAEESKKTGKPVSEILAAKEKAAQEKEAKDKAVSDKAEQKQEQEEAKQAAIEQQKQK